MKSNVSHAGFGARTTATEAGRAFAEEIRGKVSEWIYFRFVYRLGCLGVNLFFLIGELRG
jgi:hypothetical protein